MDTDKSDDIIRSILGKLNREVVPKVKENARKVEDFMEKVRGALPRCTGPDVYHIQFVHCGSAFEGLAVKEETDFDITMILGNPFESDNFTVRRPNPSGFFTLEWKSHLPKKFFCDSDNFLDAAELRRNLFTHISRAIDDVDIPDAKVDYEEQLVALTAKIKYTTGKEISVDFVPQIVCRTWGQCPDLRPLSELPKCLRAYIDTLNKNKSPVMSFSMAAPNSENYPNPRRLFSVSFGLLEKNFLHSEVNLRDMVRMVKLKAFQQDWKRRYKFQSFFAKRIAVKHCDELQKKGLCEGYKAILSYLSKNVENGFIEDYFITNLVAYRWKPERAFEFQEAIARAMSEDPSEILRLM